MAKRKLSEQQRADRALCPVAVSQRTGLPYRTLAAAMRTAGVTEQLTVSQVQAWLSGKTDPPEWFTAVLADRAAKQAKNHDRQQHEMRQAVHQAHIWRNPPEHPTTYAADTGEQTWCTRAVLRFRGWTDAAMRDYLPTSEGHKLNPRYASAHPMPVWTAETVGRIERTPEWQQWLAWSLRRRKLATTGQLQQDMDDRMTAKMDAVNRAIRTDRQHRNDADS